MWLTFPDWLRSKQNILGAFSAVIIFVSCGSQPEDEGLAGKQGYALGTTYSVRYKVEGDTLQLSAAIDSIFDKVNESLSSYLPTSTISSVNREYTAIQVNDSLFNSAFNLSREVWRSSNGKFDPTVGGLMELWGFGSKKSLERVEKPAVDSVLAITGFNKVGLTSEGWLHKSDSRVRLDFNAVAKGFAIDMIARMLEERRITQYSIELGGEILTKGDEMVKLKNWIVAIDHPDRDKEQQIMVNKVRLQNVAMASSGNYRKFIRDEETGEYYVHVVDPVSGYPIPSNVLSVAVMAPSCAMADAYATAFLLMPLDSVKTLLKRESQLEAFVISADKDGDLIEFRTRGFQQLLTP